MSWNRDRLKLKNGLILQRQQLKWKYGIELELKFLLSKKSLDSHQTLTSISERTQCLVARPPGLK